MSSQQVELLKQRVLDNSYDTAAWEQLLTHYQGLPNTHQHFLEKQELYEKLVSIFPTAVGYWRQYAEAALAINDQTTVKSIFGRCLLNSVHVELWNTYLRFIKKVNERKGAQGIPEVKQAFEFTLERVGQDIHAGAIYQEFISFLQSPKSGTPAFRALYSEEGISGQEDAHRIAILRKYYQKAVTVPTHHLDALWKAYESFEKSCPNKVLGKKLLEEMRSRYMSARRVYQERKKHLDEIKTLQLAVPPGDGCLARHEQVVLWQQYLDFEKSNPQRLDPQTLVSRVSLAYAQALTCLVHHPEIWLDLAKFHLSSIGGGLPAAIKGLERARGCLPNCLMLHFAMADIQEVDGQIEKAKDIYEELVKSLEGKPNQPGESDVGLKAKDKQTNIDVSDQPALVWITYMRFLRRVENVKTSRELFIRATKSGNCPWSVYVAAALLEWRSSKEQQNAVRIFEKGMAKFLDSPPFVLQYIDFLLGIGDLVNARAVFERALAHEQCEKSQDLWEKYIQVLYETGDLRHAREVEERHRAVLGDSTANGVMEMVARYKFLDESPFAPGLQTVHMKRVLGIFPTPPAGYQSLHSAAVPRTHLTGSRGEPLKLPTPLANFINSLPPIQGGEGPVPDVDRVLNVLLRTDLSPASVSQKCADFATENDKNFRGGVAPSGEDLAGKKRKLDGEGDGLYPGQQWEPSVDEYRLRMRLKRSAEEQQVAAARAAAKSSRSGTGTSAIEVP